MRAVIGQNQRQIGSRVEIGIVQAARVTGDNTSRGGWSRILRQRIDLGIAERSRPATADVGLGRNGGCAPCDADHGPSCRRAGHCAIGRQTEYPIQKTEFGCGPRAIGCKQGICRRVD